MRLSNVKMKLLLAAILLMIATNGYCAQTNVINIEVNKAENLKLPPEFKEVFLVSPAIADIKVGKSNTIYIYGKKAGTTNIILSNAAGQEASYTINVSHSLHHLSRAVQDAFPNENIRLSSTAKGIIISGSVSSAKVVKDVENIVAHYVEGGLVDILNHLTVSTPTQVILKVKIAEVRRDVISALNINTSENLTGLNGFTYGLFNGTAPIQAATAGIAGSQFPSVAPRGGFGIQYKKGKKDLGALIDAVNTESLATVLAEPTLVALSGETASFLSGGEIPVIVPQGTGPTTVEYKEFGIRLSFTPTVLSPGLINLKVSPEVSSIDEDNSVTLTNGTDIKALKTRKAQTSVEMASGQSLALAGLLSSEVSNSISEFPGLADIPILGALFRSTDFTSKKSELVIIVTPYLNTATEPKNLQAPTDELKHASMLEMMFLKKLNTKKHPHPNSIGTIGGLFGVAGFSCD